MTEHHDSHIPSPQTSSPPVPTPPKEGVVHEVVGDAWGQTKVFFQRYFGRLQNHKQKMHLLWAVLGISFVLYAIAFYWSYEPAPFNVEASAAARAEKKQQLIGGKMVTGYVTSVTLIKIAETLLNKPGGYLSNDVTPPSVLMDNMPNWEWGVLQQVRDFSLSMRNDISRSQTQSTEDPDLMEAQTNFNLPNDSWMLPSSESKYRNAINYLEHYVTRLTDDNRADAQFFARADNLRDWMKLVEKKLGSLSQRLSASVSQHRVNTDLAGDAEAEKARPDESQMTVKTPWLDIDNVFFEARGTAWALLHLLKAVEVDFESVLEKKNALVSLRQIIRELEATQKTVWSPLILNGAEFGLFANHCLVMSSYISRANAAIIDLRNLLVQG